MIMLFIEFNFEQNNFNEEITIRYRHVDSIEWFYLQIDILTLNHLLLKYGILQIWRFPYKLICADNPITGKQVKMKWNGAEISMVCGYGNHFDTSYNNALRKIEQNY